LTAPSQAQPDQAAVLFANVFHQVDAALLVLDEAGTITLSNPRPNGCWVSGAMSCAAITSARYCCARRRLWHRRATASRFQPGRDLLALFDAGLMPGHGLPREWVVADRDGSRHMVSISASPLIQGNVTGHVLVMQDLTEMKRMQQLMHRQHALFANGPMVAFSCCRRPMKCRKSAPTWRKSWVTSPKTSCWTRMVATKIASG
jgi:hypothetical protein